MLLFIVNMPKHSAIELHFFATLDDILLTYQKFVSLYLTTH